jgi:hypothetical protein
MTVTRDWLLVGLIACTAATFSHHVHNAEFLGEYPNMPAWLTPPWVYAAWLGATALGIGGYFLVRGGAQRVGRFALLAYAAYAMDGLLHYTRAPFSEHTAMTNVTILFEAAAAALLAGIVLWTAFSSRSAR